MAGGLEGLAVSDRQTFRQGVTFEVFETRVTRCFWPKFAAFLAKIASFVASKFLTSFKIRKFLAKIKLKNRKFLAKNCNYFR